MNEKSWCDFFDLAGQERVVGLFKWRLVKKKLHNCRFNFALTLAKK